MTAINKRQIIKNIGSTWFSLGATSLSACSCRRLFCTGSATPPLASGFLFFRLRLLRPVRSRHPLFGACAMFRSSARPTTSKNSPRSSTRRCFYSCLRHREPGTYRHLSFTSSTSSNSRRNCIPSALAAADCRTRGRHWLSHGRGRRIPRWPQRSTSIAGPTYVDSSRLV